MSEQRAPPQTPAQPADADPLPTPIGEKRGEREGEATSPGQEGADLEEEDRVVETHRIVQREGGTDQVAQGKRGPRYGAVQKTRREAKKSDGGGGDEVGGREKPVGVGGDGGGRDKVGGREKPVGVGGDGGGAAEGNGEAVQQDVVTGPPGVAVPPPARRRRIPDQAAVEENRALRAQLAALEEIQSDARQREQELQQRHDQELQDVMNRLQAEAERRLGEQIQALQQQFQNARAEAELQRDEERQAAQQAQSDAQRREQELLNLLHNAERQRDEQGRAAPQGQGDAQQREQELLNLLAAAERQRETAIRVASEAQASAERQRREERQAALNAQAAAERRLVEQMQALQQRLEQAERQRDEMIEAAQQAQSHAQQRDQENRDLVNQRNAAMLELRETQHNAARSPAPNADQGGGGEEDEDGGGEELPRMSSRDASYAAAAADGRIPNAIGPLARVIETDPRWGTDRRRDFEDTPNIGSIEQRRYNRSAGNILYEQNFPIGNFASVRVPMPRGTPQTLALFGRNAHVATPAQSINRAIMRYEGRGVYR